MFNWFIKNFYTEKNFVTVSLTFLLVACMVFYQSCTDNKRARSFGGTQTIELPKGEKLISATWKETDLWYLTEPMDSAYIPQTKKFQESSSMGVWEGTVVFVESK